MLAVNLSNDENAVIKHDDDDDDDEGGGCNSVLAGRTNELAGALPDQVLTWQ
jgi:hypothetical protein